MKCLFCKTDSMKKSTGTYFAQSENCYVLIENVPCNKCGQCREVVYSAYFMEKIEDIFEKIRDMASKIFILDYTKAA